MLKSTSRNWLYLSCFSLYLPLRKHSSLGSSNGFGNLVNLMLVAQNCEIIRELWFLSLEYEMGWDVPWFFAVIVFEDFFLQLKIFKFAHVGQGCWLVSPQVSPEMGMCLLPL